MLLPACLQHTQLIAAKRHTGIIDPPACSAPHHICPPPPPAVAASGARLHQRRVWARPPLPLPLLLPLAAHDRQVRGLAGGLGRSAGGWKQLVGWDPEPRREPSRHPAAWHLGGPACACLRLLRFSACTRYVIVLHISTKALLPRLPHLLVRVRCCSVGAAPAPAPPPPAAATACWPRALRRSLPPLLVDLKHNSLTCSFQTPIVTAP